MRRLHLAVLLVVVACGGEDAEAPEEMLQGKWVLVDTSGANCLSVVTFNGSEIESDRICDLRDGTVGEEVVQGTFVVNGDSYAMHVTASSCVRDASQQESETVYFSFVGSQLMLLRPRGVERLERAPKTKTSARAAGHAATTSGCFAKDGTFTLAPWRPCTSSEAEATGCSGPRS